MEIWSKILASIVLLFIGITGLAILTVTFLLGLRIINRFFQAKSAQTQNEESQ